MKEMKKEIYERARFMLHKRTLELPALFSLTKKTRANSDGGSCTAVELIVTLDKLAVAMFMLDLVTEKGVGALKCANRAILDEYKDVSENRAERSCGRITAFYAVLHNIVYEKARKIWKAGTKEEKKLTEEQFAMACKQVICSYEPDKAEIDLGNGKKVEVEVAKTGLRRVFELSKSKKAEKSSAAKKEDPALNLYRTSRARARATNSSTTTREAKETTRAPARGGTNSSTTTGTGTIGAMLRLFPTTTAFVTPGRQEVIAALGISATTGTRTPSTSAGNLRSTVSTTFSETSGSRRTC